MPLRVLLRLPVPPEPDPEADYDGAYQAGHDTCLADGYSERPMTEWVYATACRVRWDTAERRLVWAMTPVRFDELTWRHAHADAAAYARWFEREYGHDLAAYLAGYDDAGAGLPSAAAEPGRHRAFAGALDALGPGPVLYDWPIGPVPAPADDGGDDGLPF